MRQQTADSVSHLSRIAVNSTWRLAPDADVIWASDAIWWASNPDALVCKGIKATVETRPGLGSNAPVNVMANDGLQGKCSGYAAVRVALAAGARRVLLLGFDMHGGHWHGPHLSPLGNPGPGLFRRWIRDFEDFPGSVLNCTPGSALTLPYVPLDDALGPNDRR